jgi:hypothetical protein
MARKAMTSLSTSTPSQSKITSAGALVIFVALERY